MSTYLCPVCDYAMAHPAADWNICPQCGTEFNYDDAFKSHGELRAEWEAKGRPFFSMYLGAEMTDLERAECDLDQELTRGDDPEAEKIARERLRKLTESDQP